jgi:3-hydroxyisobutyrate dehydrogenase
MLNRFKSSLSLTTATCTRSFSSSSAAPIGFIGLGNMGGHMAHNLLKAGYPLYVFDLNSKAIDTIKAQAQALNNKVYAASSPGEIAKHVQTVVTMLPSSPHVLDVYLKSKDSILSNIQAGSLLIDSSTIDPGTARTVAAGAQERSVDMVDAPVSGGVGGAEAGTLTFMVGGSDSAFARAQPILQKMGKNIVHCGASGTGQVAKVCNNLVLGISMVAVAEGMNLGVKLGMEPKKLAGIFNTSSARCWSSDTYNPVPSVMANVPSSRGYSGGFGTALMKKDIGLAIMAAEQAGIHLHLGDLVNRLYGEVISQGSATKDFSYIYQLLAQLEKEAAQKLSVPK